MLITAGKSQCMFSAQLNKIVRYKQLQPLSPILRRQFAWSLLSNAEIRKRMSEKRRDLKRIRSELHEMKQELTARKASKQAGGGW